jgi:hypothetical protein
MQKRLLSLLGERRLRAITNGVRQCVSDLLASDLSGATTRQAVLALRQCWLLRSSTIVCNSIQRPQFHCRRNAKSPQCYLSQLDVERLLDEMPGQYRSSLKRRF